MWFTFLPLSALALFRDWSVVYGVAGYPKVRCLPEPGGKACPEVAWIEQNDAKFMAFLDLARLSALSSCYAL